MVYIPGTLAGATFGAQLAVEVGAWESGSCYCRGYKVELSQFAAGANSACMCEVAHQMSPKPWEGQKGEAPEAAPFPVFPSKP